ncbi:hypothetical protein ACHAXR_012316 [Thalassiosira sp. AJA248-18]
MKPRPKRNRKRRGGIGCLVGDGESGDNNDAESPSSRLRVEVVPLSKAFGIISDITQSDNRLETSAADAKDEHTNEDQRQMHDRRRVSIIHPYPYTFATFAKARWVGRTVVDIYHEEFGSYPRSYYAAAIKAGRILVSGKKVDCGYQVKGGDELTHTVHRHEPAVGLADLSDDDGKTCAEQSKTVPPIQIVHEDDALLVVDKPATLPIHPCGGYNFNSLFEILSRWKPDLYGSGDLFTVHRLDRLTSGLVLVAKSSATARSLGKCIMERDGCEKIYLARVKGQFPRSLQQMDTSWKFQRNSCGKFSGLVEGSPPNKRQKSSIDIPPPCQYGEVVETDAKAWSGGLQIPFINRDSSKKNPTNKGASDGCKTKSYASLGYWMTDGEGAVVEDAPLNNMIDLCEDKPVEEMIARAIGSAPTTKDNHVLAQQSTLWLNFACPCRIASHKNGVCEAGNFSDLTNENDQKGIKPAQTSSTLLSYDASSDTSLVVAKPVTGRTHQIRLHLQAIGHPIANDHCYGGELWFGDEEGKEICEKSREWLDRLDRGETATSNGDSNITADATCKTRVAPENSTNADTPATDAEIYHAAADRPREEGETILDFIEKTCVWCARCRGVDDLSASNDSVESEAENESAVFRRTLMEYLVRSQGIWLHALQYSLKTKDDHGQDKALRYRTNLPSWASM